MVFLQASRRGELRELAGFVLTIQEIFWRAGALHAWAVRTISSVYGKNRLLDLIYCSGYDPPIMRLESERMHDSSITVPV